MSEFARAVVDKTVYGYATEYMIVDGKAFSFEGHNYLVDIYQDNHPYQVVEKAAQMGGSVLGMARAFFVCDKLGLNVIYFFPTDEDVREFSKGRVAPVIRDSPHLKEIVGDADAVGLRNVGKGFLYFRGMRSNIRMKSVPADLLIFDELDEVTSDQLELADQRLNHSALKWRYMLSTPTYDNYGIDREFRKSDQRYWNLVCKKCNTLNIMEKQFPECIRRVSETRAILICRKCESELDSQYGIWVPEKKTDRIRGYHLCSLYGIYTDLSETLYKFHEGRNLEEFYRSKLGLPWVSTDQKLTEEIVERCCYQYSTGPGLQHTYMGVDQRGSELHVVIRGKDPITKRPRVVFIGRVKVFTELDHLMRVYDVDLAVVDGTPNQHSAREFCKRFPGRAYMNYYVDAQRGSYNWKESQDSESDNMVLVNRTESLDAMFEEITRRDVQIPPPIEEETHTFVKQLCNIARVNEKDSDGNVKAAVYKKLGEDHYAHANNYSLIAQSKYGSIQQTFLVQSPQLGISLSNRRSSYDRSPF